MNPIFLALIMKISIFLERNCMKKKPLNKTNYEKYWEHDVEFNPIQRNLRKWEEEHGYTLKEMTIGKMLETIVGYDKGPFGVTERDKTIAIHQGCIYFHTHNFIEHGKQVYQLSKNFTDLLRSTQLRSLETKWIKSPYTSIYLQLPEDTLKIHEVIQDSGETADIEIEGIYIFYATIDTHPELFEGMDEDRDYRYLIDYMAVEKTSKGGPPLYTYNSIYLEDGDIFELLSEDFENKIAHQNELDLSPDMLLSDADKRPNWEIIMPFIINALLYITSADARLEVFNTELRYTGTNKAKNRKRNRNCSTIGKFTEVGPKIINPPTINLNAVPSGNIITTRFSVTPHWHTYWTGKGRKIKKLKWLCEYDKGKEFGELINKNVTVVK